MTLGIFINKKRKNYKKIKSEKCNQYKSKIKIMDKKNIKPEEEEQNKKKEEKNKEDKENKIVELNQLK